MLTFKTVKELENFKPTNRREELQYGPFPALRAIIQPKSSGERSFAYRFSLNGKRWKKTIPYEIGLAEARKRAMEYALQVDKETNPCLEEKAKRAAEAARVAAAKAEQADIIDRVSDSFIQDAHRRKLRPASIEQITYVMRKRILPEFGERRMSQIPKRDWYAFRELIAKEGYIPMANRVLDWASNLYSFAIEREIVDKNPITGIKRLPETPRARLLDGAELAAIWRAAGKLKSPHAQYIRFLMFGGRRTEVANLTWNEIDLAARVWTLPKARSKNKRELVFPLPDLAIEVLMTLPRTSDFVFSTNGRAPVNCFCEIKQRLDAHLPPEMGHWTFHDLRRAFSSHCAQIGIPLHITELLLNHVSGQIKGVAATYNRYSFAAEKRSAVEAWSRHVAQLVAGEPADNVVSLRGQG